MRPLLVLDLNRCVVESSHKGIPGCTPDAKARTKYVYLRPHLKEFLAFLFEHFDVGVWSSNIPENVLCIAKIAFGDYFERLRFVFTRDDCDKGPNYSTKKDLRRVWDAFPHWGPENTFLLDDESDKVKESQMGNYIPVYPFDPQQKAKDEGLPTLKKYLQTRFVM